MLSSYLERAFDPHRLRLLSARVRATSRLENFFFTLLLFLSISGSARNGEKKQKCKKRVERRRRENTEVMEIKHSLAPRDFPVADAWQVIPDLVAS